jgi:hypothetical protein
VSLTLGAIVVDPVLDPSSFVERWRGKRRHRLPMIFRQSSVHGVGMDRPLVVVGIGADMRVVDVRTLRPRRLVWMKRARLLLEMEVTAALPSIGDPVRFYDPSHGGTTGGVCDSDRQPGRRLRTAR